MVELLYDDDILTNFHVFSYGKIYKDNKVKYIFYDNQISLWLDKHVAVRIKKKLFHINMLCIQMKLSIQRLACYLMPFNTFQKNNFL